MAEADRLDHLEVEAGALVDSLRLNEAALFFELSLPVGEFGEDVIDGCVLALRKNNVMALWINGQARILLLDGAEQRIDLRERIDLVPEELNAKRVLVVCRIDLDHIPAHSKCSTAEVDVVAFVEDLDEAAGDIFTLNLLALFEQQQHAIVGLGRAQTVDAGDRADDDGITTLEETPRRRKSKLIEFIIDRGLFFDVEVASRDIGLGLIVVVIGDEILYGIVGEELLELVV
jgi:hypothetical protein